MFLKRILIYAVILNLTMSVVSAQMPASDCICPVIKIIEPSAPIKSGETAIFTAQVSGDKRETAYNWSVSAGVIYEGQGTPAIKVDTKGLAASTVTATVTITGSWCPTCENTTANATTYVESNPEPILIEKFTRPNCEYVLMQMDNFFTQLQNEPAAIGHIITYGKSGATAFAEREMKNWIKIRRFDADRITFARGGGDERKAEIELWLVPPGAAPPEVKVPPNSAEPRESSETAAGKTKPFIFASIFADSIGGCTTDYDLELYAETIKGDSKIRGNVVIYEVSVKAFRKQEKEILEELTKNGVVRKRLKTFYVKVKSNQLREGIELWLLP